MELSRIVEILGYTIPTIITGTIAYLFFLLHTNSEEKKLNLRVLNENRKSSLPIKLQAYERMSLYLERINPSKLLTRITSVNNDKEAYVVSLINTIEQEFEHNLTQQIYISEKCWSIIITSKNATIQLIKKTSGEESITNAQELREGVLRKMVNTTAPSNTALSFIKDEVRNIM